MHMCMLPAPPPPPHPKKKVPATGPKKTQNSKAPSAPSKKKKKGGRVGVRREKLGLKEIGFVIFPPSTTTHSLDNLTKYGVYI